VRDVAEFASGAKVKISRRDAGGTGECAGRIGCGSVASSGCDFFCGSNLRAIRSRRRDANDEWPVKVFNSSVENRVEKLCCESKTEENVGLMHFAQVVCSFHCSQKILARGVLIPMSRRFEFYFEGHCFGVYLVPLAIRLPTLCDHLN
jgi:hypothetical protein